MIDYLIEYTSIVDSTINGVARMINCFGGGSNRVRLYFEQHRRILDSLESRARFDGVETKTQEWLDQSFRVFKTAINLDCYVLGLK